MGEDGSDYAHPKKPKAAGLKKRWVILDSAGNTQVLETGKNVIMRRTSLPARDLRILDPVLGYPASLLSRERAIVVNMEHVKAIITAHDVLLLHYNDPSVAPFLEELRFKVSRRHQNVNNDDSPGDNREFDGRSVLEGTQSLDKDEGVDHGARKQHAMEGGNGPFEFVALESCLESACSLLDSEARILEQEVYLALNKLTSNINSLNLEHVQQIKGRLIPLTKRVEKIRDELEHLLNDDEDMAGMYLTDKHLEGQIESSSMVSMDEQVETDDKVNQSNIEGSNRSVEDDQQDLFGTSKEVGTESYRHHTSSVRILRSRQRNVAYLEMLLEAYFIQIDGTLNKLSALREHIDDTEDYVNIMQDDKRNQLLQMVVMIMTATLVLGVFITVEGIFGINIHIDTWNDREYGMPKFLWMIGGGSTGSILLYVIAIAWYRHKKLL